MAFLALVFDNLPCAAALLTGDDIHHLSEGAVPDFQTATESFAAPAAAKGKRRYDAVAARQHTQPEVRFPKNTKKRGPSTISRRNSLINVIV